ncbi:MAG: LPS-assembly protein LptD [Rhodoferax sp.]
MSRRRGRWRLILLAWGLAALDWAAAQSEPMLRDSLQLQESIDPSVRPALPSFVSGQRIEGVEGQRIQVEGEAMLRRGDVVIRADRLRYDQASDTARAEGTVRINRAGNVYEGPLLELQVDRFEGFFTQPRYELLRNQSHGKASRVDFLDAQRSVVHDGTLTTCRADGRPDWMPDWFLSARTLRLDTERDEGEAEGAVLRFKGVPLLPVPYLNFPLSDRRRSGFLPPTIGLDSVNGTEYAQPYYWNIAPNRDATFTPALMTKRGLNLGSEFRYLEPRYDGRLALDWMPVDRLRDRVRWGLRVRHAGRFDSAWADDGVRLDLNLNRVSDDDYWRDFSRADTALTQRLLGNDAVLSWRNGPFESRLRTLKWQTLQDADSPIVPPYDRLPQLATQAAWDLPWGLWLGVQADYTRFVSEALRTGQPNGERALAVGQIERRWRWPWGALTPRLRLHGTRYRFDRPLADASSSVTRVVPTFSLDGQLVFERDTELLGRSFRQTLEPRVFYVNTPVRDQHLLPNYDSGANDFSLATLYSDNAYVGNDRISDSHLLTLGLTSRYLDPDDGAERLRLGLAQRLRLRDQTVTLPGEPVRNDRVSDLLAGVSVTWDPRWRWDAAVQFNPHTERSERATLSARYQPGSYRTLSAAYRYQRGLSEQFDLAWQWPLSLQIASAPGRWYSVGRLNYSKVERKLVDAIAGFEYDSGCWLGRVVWERLQTSATSVTQRLMFQLEFVGFTRLGVNPTKSLQDNIPGYQSLHPVQGAPSRFSRYD